MAALLIANAGVEQYLPSTGDLVHAASPGAPARLAIGATGQILQPVGGVPSWQTPTSLVFGAAGVRSKFGSGTWAAGASTDVAYVQAGDAANSMAFDIIPTGARTAWLDIVDRDIVANGVANYESLKLLKVPSGRMEIGCNFAGTGVARPLILQPIGGAGVGIGGITTVDGSAMLELSTAGGNMQGLLLPRMTTTQRTTAVSMLAAATGLVVFDTTLGKAMLKTAAGWETITSA